MSPYQPPLVTRRTTSRLPRVLEPESMDTPEAASAYDEMNHQTVNQAFVDDYWCFNPIQTPAHEQSVLDVGTGTAQIPLRLALKSPQLHITGVDISPHMLAVGQANIHRQHLGHRITLVEAGLQTLSTLGRFPAIISNSVVHHIDEPRELLSCLKELLLPNGALFIRDLVRPAELSSLEQLVERYAADADPIQRKLFSDSLHAALTLRELKLMLKDLGWSHLQLRQTSDRHWTLWGRV